MSKTLTFDFPIKQKVSTTIAVEMQDNRGKTRRVRFKSGKNRTYKTFCFLFAGR